MTEVPQSAFARAVATVRADNETARRTGQLWATVTLLRWFSRRRCWHCRTPHDGLLLRNNRGLLYCAGWDACRQRREARGWTDDYADGGCRWFFAEVRQEG